MINFSRMLRCALSARMPFKLVRTVFVWGLLLLGALCCPPAFADLDWVRNPQFYLYFTVAPYCQGPTNRWGTCSLGTDYTAAATAMCALFGYDLYPGSHPPCERCEGQVTPSCVAPNRTVGIGGQLFVGRFCDANGQEIASMQPIPVSGTYTSSCTPPPDTADPYKNNGCRNGVGNPCNAATGNKFQIEEDYTGTGPHALRFVRHYNSAAAWIFNTTGYGWSHTYDRTVQGPQFIDPLKKNYALVTRPDGDTLSFNLIDGRWAADADVADRLIELPGGAGWQYITADDEVETYAPSGKLISIQSRAGLAQTLTYDASRRLGRVTDAFGRTLSFRYDARGRLSTLTDARGGVFTYLYDSNDDLVSVQYPDGAIRKYLYNEPRRPELQHYLSGIVDENGDRYATFKYNGWPRAESTEHAGGVGKYSFAYGGGGSTTVTDPLGISRAYIFSVVSGVALNSGIQGEPCPSCGNEITSFDANGRESSRTDFNGNVTRFERADASGRTDLETKRTEGLTKPEARTITTEWDTSFRLRRRVAEPLRITSITYDTHGKPTIKSVQATADASGALGFAASLTGVPRAWSYIYTYSDTIPGHVIRLVIDGPRADVSDTAAYDWDGSGNLISITNALGHVTTFGDYDAHGRPQRIVDPNGLATTLAYDARGRLISRNVGGEITSHVYDGVGQLKTLILPDGSSLTYTYDAAHRLRQIQDSLGSQILYTLDAMGNRVQESVFDPANTLAQTRARAYDALNRLAQDIGGTRPLTQITQYGYDNQGNLTSITDPLGHLTTNVYDALNRRKLIVDPAAVGGGSGGNTQYTYDGLDQLTQVIDPRGLATSYTIDGLGNLTRATSPDTGVSSSGFDAAGNLTSQLDPRGISTRFIYDPLNRLTQATYIPPAGSSIAPVAISYSYDQGLNGLGRLTGISDPSGTTSYAYDVHGRLTQDTHTIAGVSYVTTYTYDSAGRLTRITYPSGRSVDYSLDTVGRISQVDTSYQGVSRAVLSNIVYRPFGPVKSFSYGNTLSASRTFDLDGRIASYTLGSLSRSVNYDDASRITGYVHTSPQGSALDQSFAYDNLDRLTSWSSSSTNQTFVYDLVGNRISHIVGANNYPYTYSALSNQLNAVAGPSADAFQYDPVGNLQASAQKSFAYDARHRLIQTSNGQRSATYALNALGQRVMKAAASGIATIYHYDSGGHLIAESDGQGNVQAEYIYLGDMPVAVIQ